MPQRPRIDETAVRFKERLERSPGPWAKGWSSIKPTDADLQAQVTYIMHEYPRTPEAQKLIGPPVSYRRYN